MLRLPITHDKSLEAELGFKNTVHKLGVLAAVGVIDEVVRAHEGADSCADSVSEGPGVELVQGAVVHVGGEGLGDVVAVGAGCFGGLAEVLLFVGDPVLPIVSK